MKTHYIYWYFCEYSGLDYMIFGNPRPDTDTKYHFVQEIELPDIPKEKILQAGVEVIDKEIAALQFKITQKHEKKQQLLAISHEGG